MELHKIFAASVVSVYVMLAGGCHNVMYTASQGLSGLSSAAEVESRRLADSGLDAAAAGRSSADAYRGNVWDSIISGFSLGNGSRAQVIRHKNIMRKTSHGMNALLDRSSPYIRTIYNEIRERGLPSELVLVPLFESGFKIESRSHMGAVGFWQMTPITARHFGLKVTKYNDERRDVRRSTDAALDLLSYLNKKFDGDWLLTLAAYNCGITRVTSAIKRNKAAGLPADFWHLNLPKETSNYVPRILALASIMKDSGSYGIRIPNVVDHPVRRDAGVVTAKASAAGKADKGRIAVLNSVTYLYSALRNSDAGVTGIASDLLAWAAPSEDDTDGLKFASAVSFSNAVAD